MKNRLTLLLLTGLLYSVIVNAQSGILKGKVIEQDSQEPLVAANIILNDTTGTYSDANGLYSMELSPGRYLLQVTYIGYQSHEQEIVLTAGQTLTVNIALASESAVLKTATVTTGKFRKPLGEVTVSLEVLKADLVQSTNKVTIDGALEKIPGVRVIDGQANIRGGSGYSQGAGSRVLLLVDDMPILQADAGFPNWGDIPVEILEQIEVVKGAASALYGSAAMNGIINVRTAVPRSEPKTKASVFSTAYLPPRVKSLQWWDSAPYTAGASFSHAQKIKRFDMVVGGYFLKDESYNKDSYNRFGRVVANTKYRITDRLAVGLNFNVNHGARSSFFYWLSDTLAYQGFIARNPQGEITNTTYSLNKNTRFNIDPYVTFFDKSGNKHRLLSRFYSVDNNITEGRSNQSLQIYGEYQFQRNFKGLDMVLTAGLVAIRSNVTAELYGDTTFYSRNLAGYAQLDKKFFDRLNVSAGFRYEANVLENPGFTYPFGTVQPSSERESRPVFRLGLNYQLFETTYLRGSLGQAYRYPTIAEKFIFTQVGGFTIAPNPTLQSESGWSAELGIKQGFKISSFEGFLDIAAFINKYEDMMEFNLVPFVDDNGFRRTVFRSVNIGGTRIQGYEVTIAGRGNFFGLPTNILTGYTYIDPKFDEFDPNFEGTPDPNNQGQINANNSSSDDNILKYRSRHMFKLDIETQIKKFSVGLESFYASDMIAIDAIFNLIVPGLQGFREANNKGYNIYNFRAAYRFSRKFKLSVLFNNAFNIQYSVRPGIMDAPRSIGARFDMNL